jgi:hypothetical protein
LLIVESELQKLDVADNLWVLIIGPFATCKGIIGVNPLSKCVAVTYERGPAGLNVVESTFLVLLERSPAHVQHSLLFGLTVVYRFVASHLPIPSVEMPTVCSFR